MTDAPSITALFADAQGEGAIGADSLNLLTGLNLNDQLAQAMGINADDVNATELTLVTLMLDSSGSMNRMADEARKAQHEVIDALEGSKQSDGVLMATWTFDPQPVHGYQPLTNVPRLDHNTYSPNLGYTPLFDAALKALAGVVAKAQEFAANGQPVRSVTAIISDGGDNRSRHAAADVATLVGDLERQEMHIVMFIGIDDGYTDFHQVGLDMGIQPNRILTIGNSPSEFRRAMVMVSQSAIQVSQAAGTVSQVGFGAVTS